MQTITNSEKFEARERLILMMQEIIEREMFDYVNGEFARDRCEATARALYALLDHAAAAFVAPGNSVVALPSPE